ncbi:MAG: DUF3990 domain-containing protein [Prevotellaceae bacterium]|jgi:hypothetical protein|nr:DUF3990 domain-containing protein [Prevotellaceae bacterium]
MKVYHGSYTKIKNIDLSKCEPHKDFGQGFYVTKIYEQALIWANRKGQYNHTKGIITEFNFFERAFSDKNYKTLQFNDYNNEWLDFVVLNRNFNSTQLAHDYDIIEGPVADDKITTRIDAFIRGDISREEFLSDLSRDNTHQICFCTQKSLLMLEQIDFSGITAIERISENVVESLIVDNNFSETEATDFFYNSAIYSNLTNIETNLYQKSWQEIYTMLKQELAKN